MPGGRSTEGVRWRAQECAAHVARISFPPPIVTNRATLGLILLHIVIIRGIRIPAQAGFELFFPFPTGGNEQERRDFLRRSFFGRRFSKLPLGLKSQILGSSVGHRKGWWRNFHEKTFAARHSCRRSLYCLFHPPVYLSAGPPQRQLRRFPIERKRKNDRKRKRREKRS